MDRPLPWLRYVDADDLEGGDIDLDGLKVRDEAGEKLGSVNGFIVDADSGRPYYVVADSGGWFKSREFLLPVGHVRVDDDGDALIADVSKTRVDRFPGFDKRKFEELSEDELRNINDTICVACSTEPISYSSSAPLSSAWDRADYRQPEWWTFESVDLIDARDESDRAQPGDVIGLETGGEQTHIGDTTEDEDKRRSDAEETVRKSREK